MKNILIEKDIMKQYTKLVAQEIESGRIMKGNRGSNSMYEFETHFQPVSSEFYSLIIALERKVGLNKDLGLSLSSGVDVYDLVVKNIKGTFDDGEIMYSKRFFRLTDSGKYFYVDNIEDVLEIESKRNERWKNNAMGKRKNIPASLKLVEKIKHNRGFKNAKTKDLEIKRFGRTYSVINKSLVTRPELEYKL